MKGLWTFQAAIVGFTAYSYLATTVTAAWFLRRNNAIDTVFSLAWAAALYAPWLVVAAMVWRVLRRFGPSGNSVTALAILTAPTTLATAWATALIDAKAQGRSVEIARVTEYSVDRLPVCLLLFTAVAAIGLAASHWHQNRTHSRELARLNAELERVRQSQARQKPAQEKLIVSSGRSRVPVEVREIEWIGAAGNYVVVHWRGREGLLRETLSSLEDRLGPLGFVRSHRSALVNLARVRALASLSDGAWRLSLTDGSELVVSRAYRDRFMNRFHEQAQQIRF